MELYKINDEMLKILSVDITEENLEEMQNKFLWLDKQKDEKINNTIKYIKSIEWDFENIDTEIKRLQELKKSKKSKIDSLKDLIQFVLDWATFESHVCKIWYRKSEQVIVDVDLEKISLNYIKIKETKSVDKVKAKKDIKAGKEINGIHIETIQNLSIK